MKFRVSVVDENKDESTVVGWQTCDCNEEVAKKIKLLLDGRNVKQPGTLKVEYELNEE